MQLILEKIAMPSQSPHVARPRLLSMLRKSLDSCSSTLISGRAGSGKTMLAADFGAQCGQPVAWYKVDAPDAEQQIFFRYLVASIQQRRPSFGTGALKPFLDYPDHEKIPLLAEAFVYELLESGGDPLLLAIEDLHHVCDSEWLVPFLRRMLPLLPREVHVLITSRTVLPAPLWRMRSKQSLAVIDEATLAFTKDEAVELFRSYGISAEKAVIALEHSHERAAALAGLATSGDGLESPSNGRLGGHSPETVYVRLDNQ